MSLFELVVQIAIFNVVTLSNGPVMITLLRRSLVDDRRAIGLHHLLYAFTIGRLTPGPASAYVASIGFTMFGLVGALLTTVAIVLPAFLMIPLVGVYRRVKHLRWVRGATRGVVAAQVGLLFAATAKLGRETLTTPRSWSFFLAALIVPMLAVALRKKGPKLALPKPVAMTASAATLAAAVSIATPLAAEETRSEGADHA